MVDRKFTDTAAAKTIETHDSDEDLSSDIKEFLLANRAKVMKFFADMMDPEHNAAWSKAFESYTDLTPEFKATALVMFEDAVDAKVAEVIDGLDEELETTFAALIQERAQLLDYVERECPIVEDQLKSEPDEALTEACMARYVNAIRRTSGLY